MTKVGAITGRRLEGHLSHSVMRETLEVQNVQPSTDAIPEKAGSRSTMTVTSTRTMARKTGSPPRSSRTILCALKTHSEMMIDRLYIAALRTRHHKMFINIVRIVFDPLARNDNIMPSSWSSEEIYPDGDDHGPYGLRLRCPALTRQETA